jgi:hypothetical protein
MSADFEIAERWFASRGWRPLDFQRDVWQAYLNGESGFVHAATGTGKTLAAWWGPTRGGVGPRSRAKRSCLAQRLELGPMCVSSSRIAA